ncbi:DedA family protein [Sutcliffiella horikoshii]|uniref:DedA family protein n=1 Tax=Sutcliffiella horikoshii TaxID=79883 RepID=UPI00384F922F
MFEEIILTFIESFKDLSYFGVVLALTFEFIPAELVLPLVGYWVYQGDLNLVLAILAGSIGGVTGPLTLYALGRFGGRPLIDRYGKYFFIREKDMATAEVFFEKYGAFIAFLGRFIPGVRTVISVPCGLAKMNVVLFILYTYLAMLPITAAYVYVGFRFGPHWADAASVISIYLKPLGIGIFLVLIVLLIFRYRKNQKRIRPVKSTVDARK